MLDWSWATERLSGSYNYVIVTVRPDGRPHAMGMHGLWHDDAYYFGTDPATRKAKNWPRIQTAYSSPKHERVGDRGRCGRESQISQVPKGLSDAASPSRRPLPSRSDGSVFKLVPRVVFAFPLKQIATAVTKWVFE